MESWYWNNPTNSAAAEGFIMIRRFAMAYTCPEAHTCQGTLCDQLLPWIRQLDNNDQDPYL
jgi:hypothetical protein